MQGQLIGVDAVLGDRVSEQLLGQDCGLVSHHYTWFGSAATRSG
ncbi:hypothetical protein [Kribbella sp. NPDC049227]